MLFFFFNFLGRGLHLLACFPHMRDTRKLKGTIVFEQKFAISWQLEFHQISNIWLILDSRRRQKGIVWTYWKSTHKSYSWICNIPVQIANVALKYCHSSISLDPVQDKLMNNVLPPPSSTPFCDISTHFLRLLPVAWARLVQMNLKQG